MKRFSFRRFSVLFGLATAIATSAPVWAITPSICHNRYGGDGGRRYFTGWSSMFLSEIVVFHGTAGGHGNVVNGLFPTWCGTTSQGFVVCEQKGVGRAVGTRSVFSINWQGGERLMSIQGRHGKYIDSLQFETNVKTSPLFGPGPLTFIDGTGNGRFLNDFWGTAGSVIDSIGVCAVSP